MSESERGGISWTGAIALTALAFVVSGLGVLAMMGVALLAGATDADAASRAVVQDPMQLALCQLLGLVVATGVGTIGAHGEDARFRSALAIDPTPLALIALALTAGYSLQFPLHDLANRLAELHPALGFDAGAEAAMSRMLRIDSVSQAILVPLAVVAIPAVGEELLFRGLLLPGLERRHGAALGLPLSALLFGLFHGVPVAIAYATVAGLLLGWLRLRSGSVLPSVAMHGAFNAAPLSLPVALVAIPGFNAVGAIHPALSLGGAAVTLTCLATVAHLTSPRV